MVKINRVQNNNGIVEIEYISNGIIICSNIEGDGKTPQQIAEEGYADVTPYIDQVCKEHGIVPDHTFPVVENEAISIELVGVEDVNYVETQSPIEKYFSCKESTAYGKENDITDLAEFNINPYIDTPTESKVVEIFVNYKGLSDTKSFNVTYKSYAEYIKTKRIGEIQARIEIIRKELSEDDWKTIKYTEGELSEDDWVLHKTYRANLRLEYNSLENELRTIV